MMMRRSVAILLIVLAGSWLGGAVANAARGDATVTATFNGKDIATASTAAPLQLEPGTLAKVVLDVANAGSEPLVVKRVELSGKILGLNFYRYVASTELTVQPGATGTLSYQIDLTDLDRQATGLIRADLTISDESGRTVTVIPTVTDVQGSLWSVTGLFGVVLIAFTVIAFVRVARAVAGQSLPANRAQRGLRFLMPGLGLLLVLGFTASVLRLWSPSAGFWFGALGVSAIAFFALGYFSPMPGDDDDVDYDRYTDQYTEGFTDEQYTVDLADGRYTDDFAEADVTEQEQSVETGHGDDSTDAAHPETVSVGDPGQRTKDEAGP